MPDYLSEYYMILNLDEEATYQDVIDRHNSLILALKDNPTSDVTETQINLAKERLSKLLTPVPIDKLVLVIDLDLTITKLTTNSPEYLNNCDDATILRNVRNPDEFKKLVITAIQSGHRVAIATFNEKTILHNGKKIYLARRFLLALFDDEIVSQIWIASQNDSLLKNKVRHIRQIQKVYQAKLLQIVMIDDDDEILTNTTIKLKPKKPAPIPLLFDKVTTKNNNPNTITTFNMPYFQDESDLGHLIIMQLLTIALSDVSFLKRIPQIIESAEQYLKLCHENNGNQRKIIALFKKYIQKDFAYIPTRTKLSGLMALISHQQSHFDIFSELLNDQSFCLALCCDAMVAQIVNIIAANKLLPTTSTDNWNKNVIITAIINARNQYIVKFKPNTVIQLPAAKLLPIAIESLSQLLTEIYLSSLSRVAATNLLYSSLTKSQWTIASVLIRIHNKIIQNNFDEGKYPPDMQNSYIRFFRRKNLISAEQQALGTELLLLLRTQKSQAYLFQHFSTILFHYLALEITYGDIENFISALNQYNQTSTLTAIKSRLLVEMLNMKILPVSCEINPELIKPWLTALLGQPIELNNTEQTTHQLKLDIIQLGNIDIFDLLNKHFSLFVITCDWIKYCIDNQQYNLATHLLTLIDINNITEQSILNILHSPELSLSFLENAYTILKSKGMQISAIDLQQLLLNAIEKGNICHAYEIIKKHPVLINEHAIRLAIKLRYANMLRLLLEHTTIPIDSNKLFHDVVAMETNPFSNAFTNNVTSTKTDLFKVIILVGKEINFDQTENIANPFLHQLIAQEDRDSIALLLRLGFNPCVTDFKNRSALTLAKEQYHHVDVSIEEGDSFEIDFADLATQNSSTTLSNLDFNTNSSAQIAIDEIIALLTDAENNHKAVITSSNMVIHFYHLVQSNQLTATIKYLNQNSQINSMLADKNNPLGVDLLNIMLFKTHNSLMLKYLLSAGISVQICEPAMHRILFQVMHLILEPKPLNEPIYLEIFEILCIHLLSNLNAKKIFNDIELLRMFILIAAQDSLAISSGMNLIDKFVTAFGAELFYQPLLTENITDVQAKFLTKIREVYPINKLFIDNTVAIIPTLSSTASTAVIIPVTTNTSSPASTILRNISNTPGLLTFTNNGSPEHSNKRKQIGNEVSTITSSISP